MEFRVLGPVAAADGERTAKLGGPRQRAVLAMLALAAPDVVSTDRLVDGIWGEDPPGKPLPTLQVFIHNLRKALRDLDTEADLIHSAAPGYRLSADRKAIDVVQFERLVAEARGLRGSGRTDQAAATLERALGLWRGPALADVRDAPFADPEVARLDDLRLLAEEEHFDLALQLGRHQESVATLEERVRTHPTRERFWGQLMVALYRSDRQADALAAYGRAREQLADELGIDPGEALQQLELAILRQDPALTPEPAKPVAPRPQARVPVPATATFGRDDLVADVVSTLAHPDVRVVTLTGPGGSGKSRVAMLAASTAHDRHPGGVFYLTATELTQPAQLLREAIHILTGVDVPDPLEVTPEPDRPPALLVLDNLEVLTESPAWITRLVTSLPFVTVLATSRLPLHLSAEHDLDVPPLATPAEDATSAQIEQSPAVQMFCDRARATHPAFELDAQLAAVAQLCRLLDGVPLALELAAAQCRLLPAAGILRHLSSNLDLLKSRSVDVPARQQTLTTTIQWSYDQLSESARTVCDLAALFERSFTVEALETVCDDVPSVLEDLATIIDTRLVRPLPARVEIRFVVLGTVRAFARQRLLQYEDIGRRRRLLAEHLLGRARSWAVALDGPDGAVVLGRFDDEETDLTAALEFATGERDTDLAVALAVSMCELWIASGRLNDGLDRTRQVLALPDLPAVDRIRMHLNAGKLAYHLTDWERAIEECGKALDLSREHEVDPLVVADAQLHLGGALVVTSETSRGAALAAEALNSAAGDHRITVRALSMLAISAAVSGDFDDERARYEQRLELVRAHGDRARTADTLNTLAEIALDESDPETARAYASESLAIAQPSLPLETRDALITLARAAVAESDAANAAEPLRDALRLSDRTGQRLAYAQCLRVGGCLAGEAGDHGQAVRLFAAAQQLSPSPSGSDEPVEKDLAGALSRSKAKLGEPAFEREWRLGAHLPLASLRAALDERLTEPA